MVGEGIVCQIDRSHQITTQKGRCMGSYFIKSLKSGHINKIIISDPSNG